VKLKCDLPWTFYNEGQQEDGRDGQMKSFKGYFKHLKEQKLFEGINEGDVMEGIFAIAIATYLRDGEYNEREIRKYRALIEPSLFDNKAVSFQFDPVYDNLPGKPKDVFNVKLDIRLKTASTRGAFGKDAQALFDKSSDIGQLDKKTKALIKYIKNTSAQKKIDKFVNDLLKNNTKDEVNLLVLADGIAGESSGGIIKGDVALKITAKIGNKKKMLNIGEINFSLKSGSTTLANLAPYKSMNVFAEYFGVPFSKKDISEDLENIITSTAKSVEHKRAKVGALNQVFAVLKNKMASTSKSKLRTRCFNLLKIAAFGSDAADVIELKSNKIKEITTANIKKLEDNKDVQFELNYTDSTIEVRDVNTKERFWHIRTKFLIAKKVRKGKMKVEIELKMMFEVGHMVYDPPEEVEESELA
jgi:hypothetical protein